MLNSIKSFLFISLVLFIGCICFVQAEDVEYVEYLVNDVDVDDFEISGGKGGGGYGGYGYSLFAHYVPAQSKVYPNGGGNGGEIPKGEDVSGKGAQTIIPSGYSIPVPFISLVGGFGGYGGGKGHH